MFLRSAATGHYLHFANFYGADNYGFEEYGRSAQAPGLHFTLRPQLTRAAARDAARGLRVSLELRVFQPPGGVVKQQPIPLELVGSRH